MSSTTLTIVWSRLLLSMSARKQRKGGLHRPMSTRPMLSSARTAGVCCWSQTSESCRVLFISQREHFLCATHQREREREREGERDGGRERGEGERGGREREIGEGERERQKKLLKSNNQQSRGIHSAEQRLHE